MRKYSIGNVFPMGATEISARSVQFVTRKPAGKTMALVLYEKKTGNREILEFTEEFQRGNICSMIVEGIHPDRYTYNFMEDGREFTDEYAKSIAGNEVWGKSRGPVSAGIGQPEFAWEGDSPLMIPYEESIIYQLHVRGFTRHASSQVKHKGTFEGIVEKLPYLKELGITALELLPVYEFLEREQKQQTALTMEEMKENYKTDPAGEPGRINYWGYKDAYYFAPKASYSAGKHSDISFKEMVKALHKSGIEVILQFYFSPQVSQAFIAKVCRYWVQEYHIDGIRLLGVGVPLSLIGDDPLLWNTKIMYEHVEDRAIQPQYKHMASYNDGYMYAMRHFLKGDVGSLHQAFDAFLASSDQTGNVVYLTNYNTFTLNDLVSYGRKHNEANGENGRDGCDDNVSWNCGMEGPARKKQITLLREKQMKNALAMLILSKGTPVIMAGDEFANSQNGNNNPYCQDNAVSWLNWKDLSRNQEQFQYTCKLIHLVKEFPILKQTSGRKNGELYPSLSFHGREAWKLAWDQSNEEAGGILYYGAESCIYLCFNMNWEETALAIPNLPGEITWELLLDTACPDRKCPDAAGETKTEWTKEDKAVAMAPRSIKIIAVKGSMKFDHEGVSAF